MTAAAATRCDPRLARRRVPRGSLGLLACWSVFAVAPTFATVPPGAGTPPAARNPPVAPAISVSVALPASALTVGERAEAVISLRAPAGQLAAEPRFPEWRDAWGDAEVRAHGPVRRFAGVDGTATFSQRLVLAAFRPGRVELPRLPIAVPLLAGTIQAWTPDRLALTVRSVLPADGKDLHPRPPTPLRRLPLGTPFLVSLAALAAAAAAGLWLLWRRRQNRLAQAAPGAAPALPPYAELLKNLDRLEAEPSWLAMHTGLSQAFRRYLGRTFGFPAPESTTSEIQRRLVARGWPSPQVRTAVELLRACDLVKFARAESPAATAGDRGRDRLATARRLAEECEARAAAERAPERIEAVG
jgi:hypothetical protein